MEECAWLQADGCDSSSIDRFMSILDDVSCMWHENRPSELQSSLSTSAQAHSTLMIGMTTVESDIGINQVISVVPVVKERLAMLCLDFLFLFCSVNSLDAPNFYTPQSNLTSMALLSDTLRQKVAASSLPVLMRRCTKSFARWATDKPLYGHFPFPRLVVAL